MASFRSTPDLIRSAPSHLDRTHRRLRKGPECEQFNAAVTTDVDDPGPSQMPILNRTKISARRQSPARHSDYAVACRAEEATDFAGSRAGRPRKRLSEVCACCLDLGGQRCRDLGCVLALGGLLRHAEPRSDFRPGTISVAEHRWLRRARQCQNRLAVSPVRQWSEALRSPPRRGRQRRRQQPAAAHRLQTGGRAVTRLG